MSAQQFDEFERRMRRISKRHSKLSHGYVTSVNSDGLVVAKPKGRSWKWLLRAIVILAIAVVILKGVMHAQLGPVAYQAEVDALAAGTSVEQVGAVIMTADPVTLWISDQVSSLVR